MRRRCLAYRKNHVIWICPPNIVCGGRGFAVSVYGPQASQVFGIAEEVSPSPPLPLKPTVRHWPSLFTSIRRDTALDIPRISTSPKVLTRSHNPFTPEKLATLGAALRLEWESLPVSPRQRFGEMLIHLGTRSRRHRHWHRHEPVVHEQTKLRAEELGVADQIKFIHGDAAGYVSDEKVDDAACVGATWIAGGVVGTIELSAQSLLGPGGIVLIGEPYWRQLPPTDDVAKGCLANSISDFLLLPELLRLSANSATTSWKWFWQTKTAGTDTRRPSGSPCADGLKPIPPTCSRKMFEPV